MAYVRLQGLEWNVRKHKLTILEVMRTPDGNIRLNCIDQSTRQHYSHYLSDNEKKVFFRLLEELENKLFEKSKIVFSED